MGDGNNDFDTSEAPSSFWNTEACTLTLDYAWFHVVGCAGLLLFLWGFGKTTHFRAGHAFGLFALLMDYGVMYMVRGTRTLEVLPYLDLPRHFGAGDTDQLFGVGIFLFFLWFDYLGGFALYVFARTVADVVAKGRATLVETLVVLQHALLWWTAPLLTMPLKNIRGRLLGPPSIKVPFKLPSIDNRVLVLSRSSPKSTYSILLVVFSVLLWWTSRPANKSNNNNNNNERTTTTTAAMITRRDYIAALVAGLACGSLHHLALFCYGMRRYSSGWALAVTMATEWPALLVGDAYIRQQFGGNKSNYKLGHSILVGSLLGIIARNLPNDEQLTEFLISVLPGHHMQSFGTAVIWAKTCALPRVVPAFLKKPKQTYCPTDDSIWVVSTPAKSGAVWSAKLLLDIAVECEYCLAMGTRTAAGIPGPGTENPSFRGKILHALMDMESWPEYVAEHSPSNTSRCISLTRDPLHRLRSFYTYSRSGGEHWVRYETNIMHELRSAETLRESVLWFWDRAGKEYLERSHRQYLQDKQRGCYTIRFEDLVSDFEPTLRGFLRVFLGYGPSIVSMTEDRLVEVLKRHDRSSQKLSAVQTQELAKDLHVSSKKFPPAFLREVERIFLEDLPQAGSLIRSMREEMETELVPAP